MNKVTIRNEETINTSIRPVLSKNNYSLGLYVKDSVLGVGTLTYYIEEANIYGSLGHKITDEEYFSDKYKHYISNSRLGLLNPKQEGSPDKFFTGFVTNGYISCFELGSAVHELYLQPEYFELAPDLNRPSAKLGAVADYLYPKFLKYKKVSKQDILEASDIINYYKGKITDDLVKKVLESCLPYWRNRKDYKESDKTTIYLDRKTRDTVRYLLFFL